MANIDKELNQIKNAVYGREVRGSIHDGIKKINTESEYSKAIVNDNKNRQDSIEQQFDDLQKNYNEGTPSTAEVVAARTNTETTENYNTIGRRMDEEYKKVTTQLAQMPNKKNFPTTQNRWWSETIDGVSVNFNGEDIIVPVKPEKPKQTIVFIGSSTTEGTGTTDRPNKNYMQVLADKLSADDYSFHNRGIGGNNTQDVIERFYIDVAPLNPDFVFVALTIGNEGIYTTDDKKTIYQQFKQNMLKIIRMIQQIGAIPVIANQTPTQRYNAEIYKLSKQLNAELEAMGIFCVDWMGALDDLSGKPIIEGVADTQHYNDLGHIELANSIAPSMFKRISLQNAGYLQSGNGSIYTGNLITEAPMYFLPEYDITTFTASVKFNVNEIALGGILSFGSGNRVALLANGNIGVYFPSQGTVIGMVYEDTWNTLTVSFNNLSKELRLYFNGEFKQSILLPNFELEYLYVAGRPKSSAPLKNTHLKDVLLYRSRLTDEQVKQIHKGVYSQTSLELYAPLNDRNIYAGGTLINLAATTSNLVVNEEEKALTPT